MGANDDHTPQGGKEEPEDGEHRQDRRRELENVDDLSDDVEVSGDPFVFDAPQELSRRRIGQTVVVVYGLLTLAALVLVSTGRIDSTTALYTIGPFGVAVTAVVQYYFWRRP